MNEHFVKSIHIKYKLQNLLKLFRRIRLLPPTWVNRLLHNSSSWAHSAVMNVSWIDETWNYSKVNLFNVHNWCTMHMFLISIRNFNLFVCEKYLKNCLFENCCLINSYFVTNPNEHYSICPETKRLGTKYCLSALNE